jgi:hypothetical protein
MPDLSGWIPNCKTREVSLCNVWQSQTSYLPRLIVEFVMFLNCLMTWPNFWRNISGSESTGGDVCCGGYQLDVQLAECHSSNGFGQKALERL